MIMLGSGTEQSPKKTPQELYEDLAQNALGTYLSLCNSLDSEQQAPLEHDQETKEETRDNEQ